MARMRHWIGLAAVSLSLTGCVPQEKYAALKLAYDQANESLGRSQTETQQAKAEAEAYKRQLEAYTNANGSKNALDANKDQQIASLQAQLDALNGKYTDAISKLGQAGTQALPAALSNELSAFAAANPDLVEFDAARGIVKFRSDITFDVGDATVKPKAQEVLNRFATILNSGAASGYELLVAGHTDNQPVSNPETIRKGNKDNWYLSAHRAITVSEALMRDGVNSRRLGAVGYADQHPVASNSSEDGKMRNRRVEVLILPTTVRTSGGTAEVTSYKETPAAPTHKSHAPAPVLNKDSAAMDTRPVLNK